MWKIWWLIEYEWIVEEGVTNMTINKNEYDDDNETNHSSLGSYKNNDSNDENIEMLPGESEEDYRNRRQKIYDARSIERKKQRRRAKTRQNEACPPSQPGAPNLGETMPHCVHYLPPIMQPSLFY